MINNPKLAIHEALVKSLLESFKKLERLLLKIVTQTNFKETTTKNEFWNVLFLNFSAKILSLFSF